MKDNNKLQSITLKPTYRMTQENFDLLGNVKETNNQLQTSETERNYQCIQNNLEYYQFNMCR